MTQEILKVENLNVYYGGIHALKGLNFHIHKGETVSLIGANGAGKTTSLKAISGILEYTGHIHFKTQDLKKYPAHELVRLGISHSPEGRGVFAQLTVLENLELGAYTQKDHKKFKEDLAYAFELFPRLKERIKQIAGTLSGGEQQMLAIARALMSRPELLMLDEPSLGLAPIIVAQIFEIIKKLNASGMTILLVEQNAKMALKVSHRAYVVETGKISTQGRGQDLLNDQQLIQSYLGA